jgi:hypothetical protein
MEMRHSMPVWAPTEADMRQIRRAVSRERAKVAAELYRSVKALFRTGEPERPPDRGAFEAGCGANG